MKPFDVYSLFDINIQKGLGCYVYDFNDVEYLDLYCGHAVISVGHTHPYYVDTLKEQLSKIGFYSNSVVNSIQTELADKLGKISGYSDYSVFLTNSGAEANENGMKLASFYNNRKSVLVYDGAFHGRTSAAVMASDNIALVAPLNYSENFTRVSLNDIEQTKQELQTKKYCAVLIEGIQGVGGVKIPEHSFMKELRKLCTDTDTILIIDEIQSGCGRSGLFFAHQYADIRADIITMAKGIGNGFPVAATLISPVFQPIKGQLGTTFGGNYLACTAASAVIDIINNEALMNNAIVVGNYLKEELIKLPQVVEVRGKGLMLGIDFGFSVSKLRNILVYEERVITGISGTSTIRLLPPLNLSLKQATDFITGLKNALIKLGNIESHEQSIIHSE